MSEKRDIVQRKEAMPSRSPSLPSAMPLVDIYENDDEILLHAEMPGVAKENITVNVENGTLAITGFRRLEKTGVAKWAEFGDVEYRRVFSVPQAIDVNKVHAELKDGVLRLHLAKSEAAKPRQIEIKAA